MLRRRISLLSLGQMLSSRDGPSRPSPTSRSHTTRQTTPSAAMSVRRSDGLLRYIGMNEENSRFVLLGLVLLVYLVLGAVAFSWIERQSELETRQTFTALYDQIKRNMSSGVHVNPADLDRLLNLVVLTNRNGVQDYSEHWDMAGSFHFCTTIVSTIGWGWTTPQTASGKLLVIFYGLFGCAGGILFFNLFLERFITLLSFLLRGYHVWLEERYEASRSVSRMSRRLSAISAASQQTVRWKPSVYWVLFFLLICTGLVMQAGTLLFISYDGWSYLDASYYSFVTFATIGFGDLVAGTRSLSFYGASQFYGIINFLLTSLGVCCMYSLFNIISIIIKQVLNAMIAGLNALCCCGSSVAPMERAVVATHGELERNKSPGSRADDIDLEATDVGENRIGSAVIRTNHNKDLFQGNKVSLAVMQQQLYENATQSRATSAVPNGRLHDDFAELNPCSLGSVAMVSKQLEGDM